MWIAPACIGVGVLVLAQPIQTTGGNAPEAAKRAVLDIMSLQPGDCTLKLEHHWGGISGNHIYFDNHAGPFEAVVEPSASGVRVTFTGWEEHPFVAKATKIRIVYRGPGAETADFVAGSVAGGNVQLQPVGHPAVQGYKVSIRLGGSDVKYSTSTHK
jgi:hypothetical protein